MIDIEKFVLKSVVERNPLIRVHLIALKYFGYILLDSQRYKRLHCFRGVVFSVSFVLFNVTQVSITFVSLAKPFFLTFQPRAKLVDLFGNSTNVDEITKNAATTLLFATTSFRMINFYWNRLRYVNVVISVDEGMRQMIESTSEIVGKISATAIRKQRLLTACFWIIALITGNLMCVHSLVVAVFFTSEGEKPPPILPSWSPCSNFWVIYATQYFVMNLGMLIVPCWHSFIVSLMVFVIIKLKVLSHKVSAIGAASNDERDTKAELVECINEREKLRNFVDELSSLISSSLFMDFIVFSALLCALLFQASQVRRLRYS